VRSIKKQERGGGIKRMNINVPIDLHNSFKSVTAAQGLEMTPVLIEFIQKYVGKHEPAKKKKGRQA
jgi:hypothetical protein